MIPRPSVPIVIEVYRPIVSVLVKAVVVATEQVMLEQCATLRS